MSLARLVVIEGPDAGREFEVPLRGGGVGRGDSCLIKLTDPTVSRQHGSIELRDGAMSFVAEAGKAVLINRAPVDVHRLEAGDEIVIGATKLAYLAVDGGVAVTRVSSNVTMEVGSRQLLALVGHDDRPRRHLAAIAGLGDRLRTEAGRDAVARATCDAALSALGAHRAFVLSTGRRVTPLAAAVASNESTQLQVPQDLVDKVRERQVVTAEANGRAVLAAPIQGADNEVIGILWIDRKGQPWDARWRIGCR
jgi:predicted component of type VI protein secretion system